MYVDQTFNTDLIWAAVRLVAQNDEQVPGTYYNGPLNDGVGATFTVVPGNFIVDSVTVNVGDSIALLEQNDRSQNGIYVCTQAGASGVSAILKRRADLNCIEQLAPGKFAPVYAGNDYQGTIIMLCEPFPLKMGIYSATNLNDINLVNPD